MIELLIVIVILPLVVGAITVALISVFSNENSTASRLSDSGDAQIVSASLVKDVDASTVLTAPVAGAIQGQNPATCATSNQTELLSLESANGQSEVSYVEVPNGTSNSDNLIRNVCQNEDSTPADSSVVAFDVSPSQTTATITCASTPAGQAECANYQTSWIPTAGVTGVKFTTTEPASQYSYTLVAVPKTSTNQNQLSTVVPPQTTSCGFASPGSGTYAADLCFVDFSPWNAQKAALGLACPTGALAMSAGVASTPYTLIFCLAVSSTNPSNGRGGGGGAITDATQCPGYFYGVDVGYDDICAVSLPTYFDPPTSEAFLGNNGFYTGVPGNPALNTAVQGSTSTVTISNIQVLDSNGNPATGWYLITGDAESTDGNNESLTWTAGWGGTSAVPTADQVLNLVWNTPASQGPPVVQGSPVGNACDSTPPTWNTTYLTGIGTKTVECSNAVGSDKTGTVMLEAPAPNSLTAVLQGGGLQAIFIGLLLPS